MRKGFTLIELVIVVAILGILLSMTMISNNEAVTTAKASDIIATMNSVKIGAMAHYIDSFDDYNKATPETPKIDYVKPYLNNSTALDNKYEIDTAGNKNKQWFVKYTFGSGGDISEVKKKLAARAHSAGLRKDKETQGDEGEFKNESTVYMQIR